jgi:hypothetical protein
MDSLLSEVIVCRHGLGLLAGQQTEPNSRRQSTGHSGLSMKQRRQGRAGSVSVSENGAA